MKGPIGLLLQCLARFGMTLDADWQIQAQDEATLNLIQHPYQQVRPMLFERPIRARHRFAELVRPSIAGNGEVAWDVTREFVDTLAREDNILMQRILICGVWTASTIARGDALKSAVCPWCKGAVEDLEHLLWRCPEFTAVRAASWPGAELPDPNALPPSLRHAGVAPAMKFEAASCFWGGGSPPGHRPQNGVAGDGG